MIICLDAGHTQAKDTKGDPGACNGEFWESVAALDIVKKLKVLLENMGHTVLMTRTGGKPELTLRERCRICNDGNADRFVSIHLNCSDNKKASGIEVLRYPRVGETTKRLAQAVQDGLVEALNWKDRGVKLREDLYVLKHTKCPAILVETGFISNDEECKNLFNGYCQHIIANVIAAIVDDVE